MTFLLVTIKFLVFLDLVMAVDKLRTVSQPDAYRGFTLWEQFRLLWNVDHEGRQAFLKFVRMTIIFFAIPVSLDGFIP